MPTVLFDHGIGYIIQKLREDINIIKKQRYYRGYQFDVNTPILIVMCSIV